MTNLYFFHLHACYSIFQNFFCAGIQFFVVLNSYKYVDYFLLLDYNRINRGNMYVKNKDEIEYCPYCGKKLK